MALMTVVDPAFERLIEPHEPTPKIATGFPFTEGPVWHSRDRCLIFSDIPGNTLPPYGLRQPDGSIVGQELPFCGVFHRSAADGRLTLLADDFVRPSCWASLGSASSPPTWRGAVTTGGRYLSRRAPRYIAST
jgi:hypothetical protein